LAFKCSFAPTRQVFKFIILFQECVPKKEIEERILGGFFALEITDNLLN